MLGELRFTSKSFYKVEVKILGGGYFNPSLCNLQFLGIILLYMVVQRLFCEHPLLPSDLLPLQIWIRKLCKFSKFRGPRAFLDRALLSRANFSLSK
jgi:hypothetical protein